MRQLKSDIWHPKSAVSIVFSFFKIKNNKKCCVMKKLGGQPPPHAEILHYGESSAGNFLIFEIVTLFLI